MDDRGFKEMEFEMDGELESDSEDSVEDYDVTTTQGAAATVSDPTYITGSELTFISEGGAGACGGMSVPNLQKDDLRSRSEEKRARDERKRTALDPQMDYVPSRLMSSETYGQRKIKPSAPSAEIDLTVYKIEIMESQKVISETKAKNKELQDKLTLHEYRSTKKIRELELELQDKIADLERYKEKYGDMKKSKTELARSESEKAIQDILNRYGYGASAPYNFSVKIEESLDLARRLKDEREHLEKHRDESETRYRELETRYKKLNWSNMNLLKIEGNQEVVEIKSNLRFRNFELDRLHLLLAEAEGKVKQHEKENIELKKKVEDLKTQIRDARSKYEMDITRLEMELQAKSSRLGMYEKLEDSLDKLVVQAGRTSDINTNIPTDPGRRIQQSIELSKKVHELEEVVTEQKNEIMNLYDERQALRGEVQTYKATASLPVSKLIRTISEKNTEVEKVKEKITCMEKDYNAMKADKEDVEKELDNAKAFNKQIVEIFKTRSSLLSVPSTSEMPQNFPYHVPEPGDAALKSLECLIPEGPPLSSHSNETSSFVLSEHKYQVPRGNTEMSTKVSSSGSYLSFGKSHPSVRIQASSEDTAKWYARAMKVQSSEGEDVAPVQKFRRAKARSAVRFQSRSKVSAQTGSKPVALCFSKVKPNKSNNF